MYAETGLMFPYFQTFSQEVHQLDDFCRSHKPNAPMGIYEYDLGEEGDLFKAPEPIIEEPAVGFDPMTAAMSMISCGEDVISPEALKVTDIESIESEQLLSEVFYECKKDILAKDAIETPLSEVLDIKIPAVGSDGNPITDGKLLTEGSFPKSVSTGCLRSMEWMQGASVMPNFLDFSGVDLTAVYGMRRAFSEGDIKTLGNGNMSLIHSPLVLPPQFFSNSTTEDRWQKLSRYRNKKSKRNFGRKIKLRVHWYRGDGYFLRTEDPLPLAKYADGWVLVQYACRKALADSQPRIRGRFAKTEESDVSKKQ